MLVIDFVKGVLVGRFQVHSVNVIPPYRTWLPYDNKGKALHPYRYFALSCWPHKRTKLIVRNKLARSEWVSEVLCMHVSKYGTSIPFPILSVIQFSLWACWTVVWSSSLYHTAACAFSVKRMEPENGFPLSYPHSLGKGRSVPVFELSKRYRENETNFPNSFVPFTIMFAFVSA